jgi:hypothetical protein
VKVSCRIGLVYPETLSHKPGINPNWCPPNYLVENRPDSHQDFIIALFQITSFFLTIWQFSNSKIVPEALFLAPQASLRTE